MSILKVENNKLPNSFCKANEIETFSKNVKSLTNQHSRIEIKQKILSEIKKGSEKERIFSDEERDTLSKFLKKIVTELDLKSSN